MPRGLADKVETEFRHPTISLSVLKLSTALFATALIPLIIGNEMTKAHADAILAVFTALGAIGCYRNRDLFFFLTPNSLIFFYTSISMALGAWGFSNGYVLKAVDKADYVSWQSMDVALTLIMLALSILLTVDMYYQRRYRAAAARLPPRCGSVHLVAAVLILPFFIFPLDLAWLGGSGDFSIIGKQAIALVLLLYASRFPFLIRWILFAGLLALFATFSIQNKREAIVLVVPMLYLHFLQNPQRLSVKTVSAMVLLVGFLISLILGMSIARGYGGFGAVEDLFDAVPFIAAYVRSEIFISALLNNIEANYFFFHAINSIEMVLRDSELIAFGQSIIKAVFVAFPRSIVSWKPDSIITLYTVARDPSIREIGGSWPISVISEFIWNFSYLALVAVFVFALLLSKLQFAILKAHRNYRTFYLAMLLFAHMNIVVLARGSGVDLYLIYTAIATFVLFAGMVLADVLRRSVGRRPVAGVGGQAHSLPV